MRRPALLLFLSPVLLLLACHRAPKERVLVVAKDDTSGRFMPRVLTIGAKGDGQLLPGDMNDALSYGDGFPRHRNPPGGARSQLLRVTPSTGAVDTLGATLRSTDKLLDVSADGTQVVVRFNPDQGKPGGAKLVDTQSGKATELRCATSRAAPSAPTARRPSSRASPSIASPRA